LGKYIPQLWIHNAPPLLSSGSYEQWLALHPLHPPPSTDNFKVNLRPLITPSGNKYIIACLWERWPDNLYQGAMIKLVTITAAITPSYPVSVQISLAHFLLQVIPLNLDQTRPMHCI
jgi:hypothetical protein